MLDIMVFLVRNFVKHVLPISLQILEQVLGQQPVLVVPLVCTPYRRTSVRVRIVPALPTPPLSNAPLVRTKPLPPVMPGTMEILVMPLAKRAMPVPLQILEQVLGQPRVLLVVLEIIL